MIMVFSGLAMLAEINAGGRLLGGEIIFFVLVLFNFSKLHNNIPTVKWFYKMLAVWLVGAMITDIYQDSNFGDIVRGWAKIFMFAINFSAIRILAGNNIKKLIVFIFIMYFVSAARLYLGLIGDELGDEVTGNGWKYGYGQLSSACALLLSAKLINIPFLRPFGLLTSYVSAAINLALNARNLCGITALSAVVVTLGGRRREFSAARIVGVCVVMLVAGISIIGAYKYFAGEGMLGRAAQAKYQLQSQGNLNIFFSGRHEILGSSQAIMDSPIIGHGSFAHDIYYVKVMVDRLAAAGVPIPAHVFDTDRIPTHSHLLGAWVEAGILGAAFWFWAIWVTCRGLYATLRNPSAISGFLVFVGLSLIWDIIFSPFGLDRRVITAAWLYLMMLVAANPEEQVTEEKARSPERSGGASVRRSSVGRS